MAWKQSTFRTNQNRKSLLGSLSKRMLFTWCMLAGFILMIAPQSLTDKFQFAFTSIFSWPISIGSDLSLATSSRQPFLNQLSQNDVQYRNQFVNLQEKLEQADQKIERLSGIRNRFPQTKGNLAVADIMIKRLNDTQGELIINQGQVSGLAVGQFVMADYSIIGTISAVDSGRARVKLFTDKTSNVAVTIGESKVRRVMQGNGNNSAKIIPKVPATNQISVGDKVLAQKAPGLLDVSMIAGIVTERKRDDKEPSVWDITVQPACEITQIQDVTVIIMNP